MIFAKNEPAKIALQEGWDAVEKKYLAVVEGAPPGDAGAGKFDSHLDESNPLKVYPAKGEGPETRHAITRYRVTKKGQATTLVELTLETGRRHQIRVQLAEAGCPIVGDKKYGAQTNPIKRIALHATSLRFVHPVTREEMRFVERGNRRRDVVDSARLSDPLGGRSRRDRRGYCKVARRKAFNDRRAQPGANEL